jgi:hypothetical protein
MLRHLRKCLGEISEQQRKSNHFFQLRIEATYIPEHWLDIEIDADKKLSDLDLFLREIWLECCGHMSQFQIGDYHYVMPYDGSFEIWNHEDDMEIPLSEAIGNEIEQFTYEYDFGSTTDLKIRVIERRETKVNKGLRVLAINELPEWQCAKCDNPAKYLCVYCYSGSGEAFCAEHKDSHGCEDEYYLPIVNSPRTGVCGYDGPGA